MTGFPTNVPIPAPVLQRFWDFVVQGAANIADERGRDDLARKIEKLRATPNVPRLMIDSVMEGWRAWLSASQWPRLTEALVAEFNTHFPTLYRQDVLNGLKHPVKADDVVSGLAQWFHTLPASLTMNECRRAAQELSEFVLRAALDKAALHDLASGAMEWQRLRLHPEPTVSSRVLEAQDAARAAAKAASYGLASSAHLLYGLSALTPVRDPQSHLHAIGATPDNILKVIPELNLQTLARTVDPMLSKGARAIVREATALAREAGAATVDDYHLLRAALIFAADEQCDTGASLRKLFQLLNQNPEAWGNTLSALHSWPTITASTTLTLSRFKI